MVGGGEGGSDPLANLAAYEGRGGDLDDDLWFRWSIGAARSGVLDMV